MAVLGTTNLTGCNSIPDFIAANTYMLFQQTAAPPNWTKETAHNNKALRVVSGAAGSGGSTAFTTVFASKTPVGSVNATTLTATSQIPSHSHSLRNSATVNIPGGAPAINIDYLTNTSINESSGDTGGGGSHTHTYTGTALDFAVQYVDLIIAYKN